MDIENIFSKINAKDYNNQLEKILENKNYSEDVKNLLLSMLYKIEAGYKDYKTVKIIVEDKKIYIEKILNIIKDKCNEIIIVNRDSEEEQEMNDRNCNFIVDKLEGKIFLRYPNERLLLYTIYKIDDEQIYLDEKYNLIRIAFSQLLNAGETINDIEVLRDFNGWNWNTESSEIPEITTNAIYQNLIYLLGIDFVKEIINTKEVIDYIEIIKNELTKLYGNENIEKILWYIYKISIIICTNKNKTENKRLKEEKNIIQEELSRLKDKKRLLNEISEIKKESLKEIKKIDNILNNKELLEQEYIKRNEKRAQYNKIFNIAHLIEILNRERKKFLSKIEEQNHILEPKFYIKTISELEKQLELLQDIDDVKEEKEKKKREYMFNLQALFLKCFNENIDKAKEKEDIIKLIYMLRYYMLINISENETIADAKEICEQLNKTQDILIKKAYELKVLNIITNEKVVNNEIIKKLLNTRIISLENISIQLEENGNSLEIRIYDADVYEKTIVIPTYDKNKLIFKLNKSLKIFVQ